ncbi:ABC transporter permease [Flavihumibacter sp. ZG627]|nr:ABC transporter permease [Flavihumibacter sp. ZG627]
MSARNNIFHLDLKEIWNYRDLLFILVRRDILAVYKQTIFGPLWFFIQPLLTALVYMIVFSRLGKFSTGNIPPTLFYLSGLLIWSYFSECIIRTSTFFKDNTAILSKVYFPRIIIPVSLIITNLVRFFIQGFLFLAIYFYYFFQGVSLVPNAYILLFPLLLLMVMAIGFGGGLIISSLTTKYKDLLHLVSFAIQLLMFLSPVIFPLHQLGDSIYANLIKLNPLTGIIEAFRYGCWGSGYFSWALLGYDAACIMVILFIGIVVFNSVEKNFVDSI